MRFLGATANRGWSGKGELGTQSVAVLPQCSFKVGLNRCEGPNLRLARWPGCSALELSAQPKRMHRIGPAIPSAWNHRALADWFVRGCEDVWLARIELAFHSLDNPVAR